MSDLSQDELTVLMIAVHGESMMAIGRWQKPIESLLQKGYMQSRGGDNFNCIITDAGRAACEARDKQDQDDLDNEFRKIPPAVPYPTERDMVPDSRKRCPHCGGVL